MKAAWYTKQGTPREAFEVGTMPDPQPGAGEVRVRIHASGINPTDTYTRSGLRRPGMPFERIIPHQDGSGVIDAVGAGVPKERIGERVWIYMAQWQRPFGTCAEYCVLPSDRAVLLPGSCDFNVGASLGVPWLTAHRALTIEGAIAGQTVLVAGGTGAVGYYVVQLAKIQGARVITTVGSAEKAAIAKAAGADEAIDFRTEDVAARIAALTGGKGVDRIIETNFAANSKLMPRVLKKGGSVIVYGSSGTGDIPLDGRWCIPNFPTIRFMIMYELPADAYKHAVADFAGLALNNKLKHLPIKEYALDQIAAAHEAVEKGNSGVRQIIRVQ